MPLEVAVPAHLFVAESPVDTAQKTESWWFGRARLLQEEKGWSSAHDTHLAWD